MTFTSGQCNDIHCQFPCGQYSFTASLIWSVHVHRQSHLVSTIMVTASPHLVSTCTMTFTASPHVVRSWDPIWSVQSWSLQSPSGQYSHGHCSPHLVSTVMFTAVLIWSVQSCSLQSPSGQYSHVHCSPHLVSRMTFTTSPHLVSTVMFTAVPIWSVE